MKIKLLERDRDLIILGLIACLTILITALIIPSAWAFDNRVVKWTMCDSLNLTKIACDTWWEDDDNPYYIMKNNNQNISLEDYYNKSVIDDKLEEINQTNHTIDFQIDINKTYIDEKTRELRDNLLDEIDDAGRDTREVRDTTNSDNIIWIVIIVGGIGMGGLYLINKNKQNQFYQPPTQTQPTFRRIQSRGAMQEEQERYRQEREAQNLQQQTGALREARDVSIEELRKEVADLQKELGWNKKEDKKK